jgi:uncharacterized protein (DUF305 family)
MAFAHPLRPIGLTLAAALLTGGALSIPARAQDAPANAPNSEAPFLAANDAAMDTMMKDMAIKPSGDVDRDFVAMMVPHHQGAIDMAEALLRYGHNEQLRRLAQEIIVTQQQEIAAMRLAVGEPLPPSTPAPDQPSAAATPMPPHVMHMHQEP